MKGYSNLFQGEYAAIRPFGRFVTLWFVFAVMAATTQAQGDLPEGVSAEKFDQLLATLEGSDEVTEERRAELLEQLSAGRASLAAESDERKKAEQFRQIADRSEQQIAEFRDRPMTPRDDTELTGDSTQTASEIVSKIALLRSERNALARRGDAARGPSGQRVERARGARHRRRRRRQA